MHRYKYRHLNKDAYFIFRLLQCSVVNWQLAYFISFAAIGNACIFLYAMIRHLAYSSTFDFSKCSFFSFFNIFFLRRSFLTIMSLSLHLLDFNFLETTASSTSWALRWTAADDDTSIDWQLFRKELIALNITLIARNVMRDYPNQT